MRSTASEITGISEKMIFKAADLRVRNETAAPRESLSMELNKSRFDSNGCRRWIWDYSHESCRLVEVDKASASRRFKDWRRFKKNGVDMEAVTCKQRFRMDTNEDLILEFKLSKVFEKYVDEHPEFTICDEVIGTMICDCIKPAVGNDCCCPYCFQIIHLLRGLKQAHDVKDSVSKNCDWDSSAEGSTTRKAMENMSEFRAACCPCGKVQNGTKLPNHFYISFEIDHLLRGATAP